MPSSTWTPDAGACSEPAPSTTSGRPDRGWRSQCRPARPRGRRALRPSSAESSSGRTRQLLLQITRRGKWQTRCWGFRHSQAAVRRQEHLRSDLREHQTAAGGGRLRLHVQSHSGTSSALSFSGATVSQGMSTRPPRAPASGGCWPPGTPHPTPAPGGHPYKSFFSGDSDQI